MTTDFQPGPPPNGSTALVLSAMGVPLYSARGLSQTLEPIDAAANMRRSINGILTDVAHAQFRKYKSKISCADMRVPALDGIWPGMTIVVDCVAYLSYPTGGSPQRTVISGSSFIEGAHTFYRPRLTMMVMANTAQTDEWDATVSWELDLEEVA
jgi:hypothetical protein